MNANLKKEYESALALARNNSSATAYEIVSYLASELSISGEFSDFFELLDLIRKDSVDGEDKYYQKVFREGCVAGVARGISYAFKAFELMDDISDCDIEDVCLFADELC